MKIKPSSAVISLMAAFLCSTSAFADFEFQNISVFHNVNYSEQRMAVDTLGNTYACGGFTGTIDFGSGVTHAAPRGGIFLAKYTPENILDWAYTFTNSSLSSNSNVRCRGVAIDGEGDIVYTGQFQGSVDFNPGSGTDIHVSAYSPSSPHTRIDAFVSKLTVGGEYLWTRTYGDYLDDWATSVVLDDENNIYIGGGMKFPSSGLGSTQYMIIKKFSPEGSELWHRSYPYSVASVGLIDRDGNLRARGGFPGSNYLFKINPATGAVMSQQPVSESGYLSGIAEDETGIYLAGGGGNIYAKKLDASGNLVWRYAPVTLNTSGTSSQATGLYLTPNGKEVWIAGSFSRPTAFDTARPDVFYQPSNYSLYSSANGFLVRLNAEDGEYIVAYTFSNGSPDPDARWRVYVHGIAAHNSQLYLTGNFYGIVNLGIADSDSELLQVSPGNFNTGYIINFAFPGPFTLTVNTVGSGAVMKTPDLATYEFEQVVYLTAEPSRRWRFDRWSGDLSGSQNPVPITMNRNKTVTAHFVSNLQQAESSMDVLGTKEISGGNTVII